MQQQDPSLLRAAQEKHTRELMESEAFKQEDDGTSCVLMTLTQGFQVWSASNGQFSRLIRHTQDLWGDIVERKLLWMFLLAPLFAHEDRAVFFEMTVAMFFSTEPHRRMTQLMKICTSDGEIKLYLLTIKRLFLPDGRSGIVYRFEVAPPSRHVTTLPRYAKVTSRIRSNWSRRVLAPLLIKSEHSPPSSSSSSVASGESNNEKRDSAATSSAADTSSSSAHSSPYLGPSSTSTTLHVPGVAYLPTLDEADGDGNGLPWAGQGGNLPAVADAALMARAATVFAPPAPAPPSSPPPPPEEEKQTDPGGARAWEELYQYQYQQLQQQMHQQQAEATPIMALLRHQYPDEVEERNAEAVRVAMVMPHVRAGLRQRWIQQEEEEEEEAQRRRQEERIRLYQDEMLWHEQQRQEELVRMQQQGRGPPPPGATATVAAAAAALMPRNRAEHDATPIMTKEILENIFELGH